MDTGSFNANGSGGGNAIADAMARLGIGQGSVLNQNPTSPNSVAPAQVPAANGAPPMPAQGQPSLAAMTPTDMGAASTQMPSVSNPENQVILRALEQKLKSNAAIEKASAGIMEGK